MLDGKHENVILWALAFDSASCSGVSLRTVATRGMPGLCLCVRVYKPIFCCSLVSVRVGGLSVVFFCASILLFTFSLLCNLCHISLLSLSLWPLCECPAERGRNGCDVPPRDSGHGWPLSLCECQKRRCTRRHRCRDSRCVLAFFFWQAILCSLSSTAIWDGAVVMFWEALLSNTRCRKLTLREHLRQLCCNVYLVVAASSRLPPVGRRCFGGLSSHVLLFLPCRPLGWNGKIWTHDKRDRLVPSCYIVDTGTNHGLAVRSPAASLPPLTSARDMAHLMFLLVPAVELATPTRVTSWCQPTPR